MKFIHTADIHLDSPMHRLEAYEGAPVDEIRQASRRAFENLIDLALSETVDVILIAGDLFDGDWRDYNTGLFFIGQVRRLSEAGIHVCIVAGNHDAAGKMTRGLPYPKTVHVFSSAKPETIILEDLRVAIHGQSFDKATVTDNLVLHYPPPVPGYLNIGMLHTSLTGREGHENYAPCTLDDLTNKGMDYWALGHVHQAEIISYDPPVVFPGCIQGRHTRESGVKGCMLVDMQPDTVADIRHHALDVIRWERVIVDVAHAETTDILLERFGDAFEQALDLHAPLPVIARIELRGTTDLHHRLIADPDHIKQMIRSTALASFGERAWIEKIIVNTTPSRQETVDVGPLKELSLVIGELVEDDSKLLALGAEALAPVFKKLPADYRLGESRIRLDDPKKMRELVEQAQALLVRRLRIADGKS
jgi:DNA repair exonuclease SbcCD nuclease subunit